MIKIGGINCFSLDEVAKQMQVNRQTISRMAKRGQLMAIRVGRYKYVPFTSLQKFAKGQ